MGERGRKEPSNGRLALPQPLPPEKDKQSVSGRRKRSEAMQARLAHLPQCQPTTDRKENNLDRVERPLYKRYTSFTGRDHR